VLQGPLGNGLPKAYVDCTLEPIANLNLSKTLIRNDPTWNFCTLAANHDAMITAPATLADLLIQLAARASVTPLVYDNLSSMDPPFLLKRPRPDRRIAIFRLRDKDHLRRYNACG
jgi:hypothetical protein